MKKKRSLTWFGAALFLLLLSSLILPVSIKPASADPSTLAWSIVDTPIADSRFIVGPSEINVLAIGSEGRTFYAVDIANSMVYKSINGGIAWQNQIGGYLTLPTVGASLPVWNIAVAPDDINFVVAITDDVGPAVAGPKRVFVSQNGGATWEDSQFPPAAFPLTADEYISCVDISTKYGAARDVAIGTRRNPVLGSGRVYTRGWGAFAQWNPQDVPPSTGWAGGNVVALKFSPNYSGDDSLVAVTSILIGTPGTFIQLGGHDTTANTTAWNTSGSYPVPVRDFNRAGTSPNASQIITADLELPSDFSGQDVNLRRYYVSTDIAVTAVNVQSGVHRVDDTVAYWIRPPATAPTTGRISSIAYFGTSAEGQLLAGEVNADPSKGTVHIWRTSDPTSGTPTWLKSDNYKSPTGGGQITPAPAGYFANAQVAWSPDGTRAYCGTSSANPTAGGTAMAAGQWPLAWTTGVPLDESAFSVSPYSQAYEQQLVTFGKPKDDIVGDVWNQLSLIDTQMVNPTFLSDVAVLEVPGEKTDDCDVLYLASINPDAGAGGFDSLWRSTSDPLGRFWERVLCTSAADIILRIKQTAYDEGSRSRVIVFADLGTKTVGYSANEGQRWNINATLAEVTDLALPDDKFMYILSNTIVYRYEWMGGNWIKRLDVDSELDSGHTIAVPLTNPEGENDELEDWVIVGESGPPSGSSRIAYADFSRTPVQFGPTFDRRFETPVLGDVHAIADDKFQQNKTIYVGVCEPISGITGKIYRWKMDESTKWDELEPPNSAFYGMAQRNDVLYGVWNEPQLPTDPRPGADRTLYARATVPPTPEWDDLTAGLPELGDANFPVSFTREPSSLKISSNEYNNLWAIDNRTYDWADKEGCLWAYTDTVAKVGPWTTAPASGEFIPVDPVSGRAVEVNFGWRQLSYASRYELQLAKDKDFSIVVLLSDNITPRDQLAPACYFPAGGLVSRPRSGIGGWGNLESNHTYYWRVRARGATTGDIVRSPWSATMYFTVKAGLPVKQKYLNLTLLNPTYGARNVPRSVGFSWSPLPGTTRYEFILAKDATLTQVLVKTSVPTTSYIYSDKLDWNTTYFWQVKAIEPVVSDPSPIGSFTVVAQPKPEVVAPKEPVKIPFWIWAVIAIYAALMAVILALVMIKPSYISRRIAGEDNISPMLERTRNPMARFWNAITMGVRRWRYLRKSKYIETDNSREE